MKRQQHIKSVNENKQNMYGLRNDARRRNTYTAAHDDQREMARSSEKQRETTRSSEACREVAESGGKRRKAARSFVKR